MGSTTSSQARSRGRDLILYDGVCGLCNRLCQFVLARDRDATFDFASLQSATGRSLLERFGRDPHDLDTFGLVTEYRSAPALAVKSEAALEVARRLPSPWRWLYVLRILPLPFRDWVYDLVARHRYRVFGRSDTCQIPRPEQRARFIDL